MGHDEEKVIRARISLIKAEAEKEKDKRFKDVALYQSEVMKLCGQLRQWSISVAQKTQKLSESPVTSHVVVKICANDCTNREIAEKCHQPVPPWMRPL